MSNTCYYNSEYDCLLLETFNIHCPTKMLCGIKCIPNNVIAMKSMLAKLNIKIDSVPLDIKELEAKIERGEVKRNAELVRPKISKTIEYRKEMSDCIFENNGCEY